MTKRPKPDTRKLMPHGNASKVGESPGTGGRMLSECVGGYPGIRREHGRVANTASGDLDGPDFQRLFVDTEVDLAPWTAFDRGDRGGVTTDFAIEQLLNRAVASTEVIDILEACGFDRPDISVLSEDFLMEIENMKHKNLAVEALKKLLNGQIKAKTRSNVVQNTKFSERLTDAIARYHSRSVNALQVIQELIALAKDLKAEPDDDLSEAERSFYDALAQNENAVEVMGNEELRIIATELVKSVRESSGTDWWQRDDVRARMRVVVKRILRRHGYPPDLQVQAVQLVIKQAEALAGIIA